MKNDLIIILGLVFLVALGIAGYAFFQANTQNNITVNKTSINKSEPAQGDGSQGVSSSQKSSQGASSSQETDSGQENTSPTSHGSDQIQYVDENGTLIII